MSENRYNILNRYRINLDESWERFSVRFEVYGVAYATLHKVCTGRVTPNERTAAKLDRWIRDHQAELATVTAEAPEYSTATVQAGGLNLTAVHGTMPAGASVVSI